MASKGNAWQNWLCNVMLSPSLFPSSTEVDRSPVWCSDSFRQNPFLIVYSSRLSDRGDNVDKVPLGQIAEYIFINKQKTTYCTVQQDNVLAQTRVRHNAWASRHIYTGNGEQTIQCANIVRQLTGTKTCREYFGDATIKECKSDRNAERKMQKYLTILLSYHWCTVFGLFELWPGYGGHSFVESLKVCEHAASIHKIGIKLDQSEIIFWMVVLLSSLSSNTSTRKTIAQVTIGKHR